MNHLLASFILVLIVSVSSLPVGAMDPKEEESGAAASRTVSAVDVGASSQAPLKNMFLQDLPLEIQYEIFETLSPKEVNRVALTSKVMSESVSKFRTYCREIYQHHVRAAMRAHESNPVGYGLRLFISRAEVEARMPPQKLQQVSPAYKEEAWRGRDDYRVSFDIFAATVNNPICEVINFMADYQKANMADVMLAVMYSAEAPPSYLERAAIHHLFSSYAVFHKEESLAEWQQQVLPGKKEGLQLFIEKTYVKFESGQVPAVRSDQKLVVKRRQLDDDEAKLDGIFRPGHPQPEMVLDFDEGGQSVGLGYGNLPSKLTKLAIINSGGSVAEIEDCFLSVCFLKTLTLSLPKVTQVGAYFLSNNHSLTTLTLSLPQLTQVEGGFLDGCEHLRTVDLRSLLNLEKAEVDDLMGLTELEYVLIDARQEEFFEDLLKNRPDLLSKFKIA